MSGVQSGSKPEASTLVELLDQRAGDQPDRIGYTHLADGESEAANLTYTQLVARARAIAALLPPPAAEASRVLLMYPTGLDFIAAFFGCLYGGAIAVPAYPPDPARLHRSLPRFQAIVKDARPAVALTTAALLPSLQELAKRDPDLRRIAWLAIDDLKEDHSPARRRPEIDASQIAFLQYTSGSTATPKGVMISHANLLHNQRLIRQACRHTDASTFVGWLPLYHDMGLIGNLLQPLYIGARCVLMPPAAFLQKPHRWLQAITRYKAATSGGPDFAYDLCVRKITPEQKATLDLGSWTTAFNGAEPVRAKTLQAFAEAFAGCGFRREAFFPCYGLAEATLIVSGGGGRGGITTMPVLGRQLEENRVVEAAAGEAGSRMLVGCGQAILDNRIIIVNPESLTVCPPDEVGEIWLSSASVAQGYWNRAEETAQTFIACLADTGQGPFLRTGDLGFIKDNQLFVAGRLKDLIIIRGRNHYPQDIEQSAEHSHLGLRPGGGAAFSVDVGGREELVIVHEVDAQPHDVNVIVEGIREAVASAHELQPHAVVLIKAGSLAKTSSGKVQRHACRRAYLAGELDVVAQSLTAVADAFQPPVALSADSLSDPLHLQRWLAALLSRRLGVSPDDLRPDHAITGYGLDSLAAIELAHQIETATGICLPSTSLLSGHSIAGLAEQILNHGRAHAAAPPRAPERRAEYPLSYGQQGLWFLYELSPESAAYNIAQAVRMRTPVDVAALRRSLQFLVNRHPSLRASIVAAPGSPTQRVREHLPVCFDLINADGWSEAELQAALIEAAARPFNLERDPLLRCLMFSRNAGDHVLLIVVHHIVTDLWSLAVMLQELGLAYEAELKGGSIALPALSATYGDYIYWQQAMLAGAEGERLLNYWKAKLAGEIPVLNMPCDRPRPPIQTFRGACHSFVLGAELSAELKALSRRHGATLYMTLLAGFTALLHRYTGQDDLFVGSPMTGRSRADFAGLVGYFVNPVVMRADLSGLPTFETFLARLRAVILEAFAHQELPFTLLVESLQPVRDPSRSPIFQVEFVLQQPPLLGDQGLAALAAGQAGAEVKLGSLVLESMPLATRGAQFDLSLTMADVGKELAASLDYNRDLFDAGTIERLTAHFLRLLQSIAESPRQPLSRLPMLSRQERQQILCDWNHTQAADPPARVFPEIFEAQAAQTPDRVAVSFQDRRLTYRQLNASANRIAWALSEQGIGPETIVVLLDDRGPDLLAALLGVLKAGGAYLPLDPRYPVRRLTQLLQLSAAPVIVGAGRFAGSVAEATAALPAGKRPVMLRVEDLLGEDRCAENLPSRATADGCAYVIFTSGSTGIPKGAAVTHKGMLNHLYAKLHDLRLSESAIVAQTASPCFDISVWQFLAALAVGGAIDIFDDEVAYDATRLLAEVDSRRVTVLETVPSLLAAMLDGDRREAPPLTGLQWLISTGEALPPELARELRGAYPDTTLLNAYGPTECSDDVTHYVVSEPPAPEVVNMPIGYPIRNTQVYVLDRHLEPLPVGVTGGIFVGGTGVGRGYLRDPGKTAEVFIPDPHTAGPGARLYDTGDLGRVLPGGKHEYLGRRDHQVKLRGFRIDLGEIESALAEQPAIREAVVVVTEITAGNRGLVAYVVRREGQAASAAELRDYLRARLPEYMVPAAFILLDRMPLTNSGKIDRKALPRPELMNTVSTAAGNAPTGALQEALAGVWASVLGLEWLGVQDDFFAVGGHSLLATQLISRLRDAFGLELPLRMLFEAPTVADFAARLLQQYDPLMVEGAAQLLLKIAELSDDEAGMMLDGEMPIFDEGIKK